MIPETRIIWLAITAIANRHNQGINERRMASGETPASRARPLRFKGRLTQQTPISEPIAAPDKPQKWIAKTQAITVTIPSVSVVREILRSSPKQMRAAVVVPFKCRRSIAQTSRDVKVRPPKPTSVACSHMATKRWLAANTTHATSPLAVIMSRVRPIETVSNLLLPVSRRSQFADSRPGKIHHQLRLVGERTHKFPRAIVNHCSLGTHHQAEDQEIRVAQEGLSKLGYTQPDAAPKVL